MNKRYLLAGAASLYASLFATPLVAAKVTADVAPPQKREATVDTAERLMRRTPPAALPPETPNPFNPASFDQPDPDAPKSAAPTKATGGNPAPATAARPPGDREILETLAMRLTPSGMIAMGNKPLLIIDRNRFEVGTKFIVTYNDQDYELALVAIDRPTFTLRYRGEEITRPIKPVK